MANSIREALEAATSEIGETAPADGPAPIEVASEPIATESQPAERVRAEDGKFAKTSSTAQTAVTAKPVSATLAPSPSASVESDPYGKPPSSWSKNYWAQYATLPPDIRKYSHERESQFAQGVSTYKAEAESAKELRDAIAPFMPDLNRYNIAPAQWIRNLGEAHKILATSPLPEKIARFQKLAQEYGIPIQSIQTGQIDPMSQQLAPVLDLVKQLQAKVETYEQHGVQQKQQQEQQQLQTEVQQFMADVKNYPHFEAAKPAMIQLLESGEARSLKSAYRIAISDDDTLWDADVQARIQQKASQANQDRQQRVATARAKTVSNRSETPSGNMTDGAKKGLRSHLEDATESIVGGRV